MENDLYSFALTNTLNEIPKICPDVKHAFIIRENGKIIAKDEKTSDKTIASVANLLENLIERAHAIEGIKSTQVDCSKGRVNISSTNGFYVVTVTSNKAYSSYVNSVTGVFVPTVLRLLEKITPEPIASIPEKIEDETTPEEDTKTAKPIKEKKPPEQTEKVKEEASQSDAETATTNEELPVTQLIVEEVKGLLVKSDTIRIDNETLSKWKELCEDKEIEEVEIETFNGKTIKCKMKPIGDSKHDGKGKVQMPEKILAALDIKKGELVRVKPIADRRSPTAWLKKRKMFKMLQRQKSQ